MLNYLLSLEICSMSSFLSAIRIIGIFITILKILIPIVIIVKGIIDIGKHVVSSKPEELTKSFGVLIRRIAAGLIIFLLPSIITAMLNLLVDYKDVENHFDDCLACFEAGSGCQTAIDIAAFQEERQGVSLSSDVTLSGKLDELDSFEVSASNPDAPKYTPTSSYTDDGTYKDSETVGGGKYFDPNDVTKISGLTEEELIQKLNNCTYYHGKAKRYVPYAKGLIEAEKKHGLNVFYMLGVYSLESGWAGSDLAQKCNNLGGIKYYKSQTYFGKSTTQCWRQSSGAWFAGFDTVEGFIEYHANLIEKNYVTPGAKYYKGKTPAAIASTYGHYNSVNTVIEIATNLSNA